MRLFASIIVVSSFAAFAQPKDVSIECAPMNDVQPRTIKVLGPEGAVAKVFAEDGTLEGDFTVPFNFVGRSETYYRFVVIAPDGSPLLDKKIEVKTYVGCNVRLRGGGAAPRGPGAPSGGGMSDAEFQALLAAIEEASFSAEKTGVIETAARDNRFTVDQVGRIVDVLSFSAEKIKAVEATRKKLVDPKNGFKLLEHFEFSGDKQKVQALLK